jgi:hypothetical protein
MLHCVGECFDSPAFFGNSIIFLIFRKIRAHRALSEIGVALGILCPEHENGYVIQPGDELHDY